MMASLPENHMLPPPPAMQLSADDPWPAVGTGRRNEEGDLGRGEMMAASGTAQVLHQPFFPEGCVCVCVCVCVRFACLCTSNTQVRVASNTVVKQCCFLPSAWMGDNYVTVEMCNM